MSAVLRSLILPPEVTAFERRYLARVNRIALVFFAAHLPILVAVASANRTGPGAAAILALATLALPALALVAFANPRHVSIVHGVTAICFGGLLVHFGRGPLAIEMQGYFVALIAMCAVFANPVVVVAAAATLALQKLALWIALPHATSAGDAGSWGLAAQSGFVLLASAAACLLARSLFDNVIGLERIVGARTAALDAKNRDMRLLLDHMQQGVLTIDRQGRLAQERSAAVDGWFGAPAETADWFDYLATLSPDFAQRTRMAWDEVAAGLMPIEVTLEQMPRLLTLNASTHYRFDYRPIGAAAPHERYLVIVTDVTVEVVREHAEREAREAVGVFQRVIFDRAGFEAFFEESANVIDVLVHRRTHDPTVIKRLIHTLKGNASVYGLTSITTLCHALEDHMERESALPHAQAYEELSERWARLVVDVEKLLGRRTHTIEIDEQEYAALEAAARAGEPAPAMLGRVRALRLEPVAKRLRHFQEQAGRIARRLDKGDIQIEIEDRGVRLDARRWSRFWSAFIHAVRNAVDHGIEPADARLAAGKPAEGRIALRAYEDRDRIVVEISDDGRGIDWTALAVRARAMGLPSKTPEDLEKALFADGVSTAPGVTDVSGRGTGMGALLEGARSLGGEVAVVSSKGKGTTLRFTFPKAAGHAADSLFPTSAAN